MHRPRCLTAALGLLAIMLIAAAPAPEPWQAPIGRDHPLAGTIWDVTTGRPLSRGELATGLARVRFVLLGETHDNPDHHRLQAWIVSSLTAAGRRPAVAFEMLSADDAAALARHLAAAPRDAAGLGDAVGWDRSGWPPWRLYQPIAEVALGAGLRLVVANLSPATARRLGEGARDALDPAFAARFGLDHPLPAPLQVAAETDIREAHCGHAPGPRVAGMVAAQRARDAHMAERLLAAGGDGAVLIAGVHHVRDDRGVPLYLRRQAPDATIASLAFLEVERGGESIAHYAQRFGGRLPFHYVWFTPRTSDTDPCDRFRKSLDRLGPTK